MLIDQTFLGDFLGNVLVACSQCGGCAHVLRQVSDADTPFRSPDSGKLDRDARRIVCGSCGRAKHAPSIANATSSERCVPPSLFGCSLWLTTPCCGEILWAYNEGYLEYLERLVSAKLRERRPNEKGEWSNGSLDSRLPEWMLAGKNRDEVVKGLARLRAKLPASG